MSREERDEVKLNFIYDTFLDIFDHKKTSFEEFGDNEGGINKIVKHEHRDIFLIKHKRPGPLEPRQSVLVINLFNMKQFINAFGFSWIKKFLVEFVYDIYNVRVENVETIGRIRTGEQININNPMNEIINRLIHRP